MGKQVAATAKDLDAPRVTSKFQEHFATSSGVWKAGEKNLRGPVRSLPEISTQALLHYNIAIEKQNLEEGRKNTPHLLGN